VFTISLSFRFGPKSASRNAIDLWTLTQVDLYTNLDV